MNLKKRYRKMPVVIEAMEWDGSAEGAGPIIDWILTGIHSARYQEHLMDGDTIAHPDPFIVIDTLEGKMIASPGDFIIKGVHGEFYPCKPDIFNATYESDLRVRREGLRIYIAGPIAGRPDGNRAAFLAAADLLTARGDVPVNPHDIAPWEHPGRICPPVYGRPGADGEHDGGCHLRADIAEMLTCDGVFFLEGWEDSVGARLEHLMATHLKLKIEIEGQEL